MMVETRRIFISVLFVYFYILDVTSAQFRPVSKRNQKIIVDAHNDFRRSAAPNASNMMKMTWDDSLAEQAMKHAMKFTINHDQHYERYSDELPGVATGQNMCYGAGVWTWTACMNSWFDEINMYKFGSGSTTGNIYDILHVSQVLYWKSSRIGCALTNCDCFPYYVCNYGYTQLWQSINTPYKTGQRCGSCPDHCDDGLCDCGGKMCMNDGTLDLSTCQCNCKKFFSGSECEILNCDVPDAAGCNYYDASFADNYCKDYANLRNDCPHYCGRCMG